MSAVEYYPIRIGTVRENEIAPFDLYLFIGGKFLHYVKANDTVEPNRMESLKQKGLKKLYILSTAEEKYLDYLDQTLKQLKSSSHSKEIKATVTRDTLVTEAENIERTLQTRQGYDRTRSRIKNVMEYLMAEKGALKEALAGAEVSNDEAQHACAVAMLSLKIAEKLGINDESSLMDLAMGALLHDIGKKISELDDKSDHPQLVRAQFTGKGYLPTRVFDLIEAHELKGEPLFKKGRLAQVMSLANTFDRTSRDRKIPPLELMRRFFDEQAEYFDMDQLQALNEALLAR